jgi:hypothetical protein
MKMRTIIRFSIDAEHNSKLRNQLGKILDDNGLALKSTTGTYEGKPSAKKLARGLKDFWDKADSYKGSGSVDHFWMYSDKPKTKKKAVRKTRLT